MTVAMAPRFAFQAAAVICANGNAAAIGGVTGRGSLHLAQPVSCKWQSTRALPRQNASVFTGCRRGC